MGRPVGFRDGTFRPLHHAKAGVDPKTGELSEIGKANKALRQQREPLIKTAKPQGWDGLSSLDFRILERRTLVPADSAGRAHFELVRVDFPGPDSAG